MVAPFSPEGGGCKYGYASVYTLSPVSATCGNGEFEEKEQNHAEFSMDKRKLRKN